MAAVNSKARLGRCAQRACPPRGIVSSRGLTLHHGGLVRLVLLGAALLAPGLPAVAQGTAETKPLPRFASLKASKVNLRKGPGTDHQIAWVYRRAGLPVQVIREFKTWLEITDAEGSSGWVAGRLLSARRTALVKPVAVPQGEARPQETLSERANQSSRAVALVEAGVIADVHRCDGTWCHVSVGEYRGYIQQNRLWGVGEREVLE